MLKIKFKDGAECTAEFSRENNIIKLGLKKPKANTSGFTVHKVENDIQLGSYLDFTTVYRKEKDFIQYSNDGSVYVPPVDPEPVEPTLEEVKTSKVAEMNATQQTVISNGVDVTLTDGTVEHFTLSDHDQTSIMGLQTLVVQGVDSIPWHTSDQAEHCKYYSNADMALITQKAMAAVTFHVTYFRDLRIYINALETKEEVNAIEYGVYIPGEYQSEVLKDLYEAMA